MSRHLLCLGLIFAAVLSAQSDNAQVSGFVKDPSGAVIAAASVVVTNEGTGLERRAATNDTGYFTVSSLPPGFYTISVEAAGFKHYVKTRNKLDPNMAATIDAELTVGAVSDTVEVVAAAAGVQTETATVGKLVESSQIQNMMLNGRNALYLALLKPGVRGGSLQTFDFGMTLGGLSVNGSRAQDNLFTYDGAIAIRTRGNNSSIGVPDIDTIQEIQILTANYNAEYGRAAGGQVRIVSRSGTRQFHGNAYEYFRNQALDANTWARNRAGQVRPANKFNQFGYNVNGPVYIPACGTRAATNCSSCGRRSGSATGRRTLPSRRCRRRPCGKAIFPNCSTPPTRFSAACAPSTIPPPAGRCPITSSPAR